MSCFCFEMPPSRQWTWNSKLRTPAAELSCLLLPSIQFGCGSDIFDMRSLLASQVKWHILSRQSITEWGRSILGEKSLGRKPGGQALRALCHSTVVPYLAMRLPPSRCFPLGVSKQSCQPSCNWCMWILVARSGEKGKFLLFSPYQKYL